MANSWACSGIVFEDGSRWGKRCDNDADYIITIRGEEEHPWHAKQGRCKECLDREFPELQGLSFIMPVSEHDFSTVPYNMTNL